MKKIHVLLGLLLLGIVPLSKAQSDLYHEPFRPQIHFSPKAHWMNDPNGMVFYKGTYHLFFQYYPDGLVWGPMHWGHAISKDLIHWQELPIAIYPDSLGYIFSGSAVADSNNTSGFSKNGKIPLVAIYTQHDPNGESLHRTDFQNQSIAYSLDDGITWTKYKNNPVLKNPGSTDFRDPKVMWYAPAEKWIMTLAVKDKISFYSSADLKNWQWESDFGITLGAHGGVWECPDLFLLKDHGHNSWVLLVNINPGGPNGGSATQYFTGNFDGHTFSTAQKDTKWLDYGPDEYAGVTWSNTGNRRIFLGWMSNWLYGASVPTHPWRSANTVPRELRIKRIDGIPYLITSPVRELDQLVEGPLQKFTVLGSRYPVPEKLSAPFRMHLQAELSDSVSLVFSNEAGESTTIGYDKAMNRYFIDRSGSGDTDFSPAFTHMALAPRFSRAPASDWIIYADVSSFEFFADGGLTTLTALVFPSHPYNKLEIRSPGGKAIRIITIEPLKSIWPEGKRINAGHREK